jgi:hypothetical protein
MLEGLIGMLAFFATILGLITGVIVIALALLTRHPQRAVKVVGILLGWLGLYTVILLVVSLTSWPRYLGLNQERCFDEMCYSVTSVTITHTMTNALVHTFQAQGNYYVLTVVLRNAGRGTPQKPSNPALFVVDAHGNRFPNLINATGGSWGEPTNLPGLVEPLWGEKIQPGQSASRTVAFDLPVDIQQPGLVVTEGIGPLSVVLIGDESSFFHAKTEFLLTP